MNSTLCKAKIGLLFLRDCDQPAVDNCVKCSRPVCKEHRIKGDGGTLCPECASEREKYHGEEHVQQSQSRNHYYHSHNYSPYYYGSYLYYSDNEYSTFDSAELYHVDPPESMDGELDDSGFDRADDYMES